MNSNPLWDKIIDELIKRVEWKINTMSVYRRDKWLKQFEEFVQERYNINLQAEMRRRHV